MAGNAHKAVSLETLSLTPRGVVMDAVMREVRADGSTKWAELIEAAVVALEQVATGGETAEYLAVQARVALKAIHDVEQLLERAVRALTHEQELTRLGDGTFVPGISGSRLIPPASKS